MKGKYNNLLVWIGLLLYLISLPLSAFTGTTDEFTMQGFMTLLFGWMGVFGDAFIFLPWFANFLMLFGILLSPFFKWAKVIAVIALCLCFLSFGVDEILVNEGGGTKAVTLGIGGYFWLAAMTLFTVHSLLSKKRPKPV